MNIASMIDFHRAKQAEVIVAAIPVPREQAREFGVGFFSIENALFRSCPIGIDCVRSHHYLYL
jgi:hypothetical protein